MAVVHAIYGNAVFSSQQRRNQVVNRWENAASGNNFVATSACGPNYGPGIVTYTWTAPASYEGDPDVVPGQNYPAFHMAYSHADKVMVDLAYDAVLGEMNKGGWVAGDFGTVSIVS